MAYAPSAARVKTHTYLCEECGDEFVFMRNTTGKYCSWSCGAVASGRERSLALGRFCPVVWRECSECSAELGPRPQSRVTCSTVCYTNRADRLRKEAIEQCKDFSIQECAECETRFRPNHLNQKYCSVVCGAKKQRRIGRGIRRARKLSNGAAESIDPTIVFKRDNWRCYICKIYTPKALRGTYDDRAPEMDHVIPLAVGGTHTMDNVRCCCRQCNSEKGATIYQTDMFMQQSAL